MFNVDSMPFRYMNDEPMGPVVAVGGSMVAQCCENASLQPRHQGTSVA